MAAHLLINDGNPWWLSPDLWVVPGNDPNGAPGAPVAGNNAYLWARVSNSGASAALGARVDFYWANPSAQMVVGVATRIGSAYADLAAGATQEVLCLTPWRPVIVNGGHECVVAVVHSPVDAAPLPDPLPNGYPFEPPLHDQVAQLNLSVLESAMLGVPLVVYVNAIGRAGKKVTVSLEFGDTLDERVLANAGLRGLRPAGARQVQASLDLEARCGPPQGAQRLELELERGVTRAVFVNVAARALPADSYQLLHVVERSEGKLLGGVSYLVVNRDGAGQHSTDIQEQQP
jgi:hypothetical protein